MRRRVRIDRRALLFFWAAISSASPLVDAGAAAAPSCPGCNVVLVTLDALRADRLGLYGSERPTSPAIDFLGRRSTVFEDCLAQSATTVLAVPAILTGRFPVTDGLLDGIRLRRDEETIATILHRAGYRTLAAISHTLAGCRYSGCVGFDATSDITSGFESTAETERRWRDVLGDRTREPFFLWVHVRAPHAPYDATADELARMDVGNAGLGWFSTGIQAKGFFPTLERLVNRSRALGEVAETMTVVNGSRHPVTPTALRQVRALYDANVRLGDDAFGRILVHLKRHGLMRRTVIVVAADHGEALGEHDVIGHNALWWAMLRTPLVVHVPGARGRRVSTPVMNVDILPTIARITGVALPGPVRGSDLFAPRSPDATQYAEYPFQYVLIRRRQKLDVNVQTQSLLQRRANGGTKAPGGPFEVVTKQASAASALWDVERDPEERSNLAAGRAPLVAELEAVGQQLRDRPLGRHAPPVKDDVMERLKAIGYISPDATR